MIVPTVLLSLLILLVSPFGALADSAVQIKIRNGSPTNDANCVEDDKQQILKTVGQILMDQEASSTFDDRPTYCQQLCLPAGIPGQLCTAIERMCNEQERRLRGTPRRRLKEEDLPFFMFGGENSEGVGALDDDAGFFAMFGNDDDDTSDEDTTGGFESLFAASDEGDGSETNVDEGSPVQTDEADSNETDVDEDSPSQNSDEANGNETDVSSGPPAESNSSETDVADEGESGQSDEADSNTDFASLFAKTDLFAGDDASDVGVEFPDETMVGPNAVPVGHFCDDVKVHLMDKIETALAGVIKPECKRFVDMKFEYHCFQSGNDIFDGAAWSGP